MVMLLFLIAALIVALTAWWFVNLFKYNIFLAKYPGPRPLPIIGNVHLIGSVTDVIPVLMKSQNQYGGIIKVMLGYRPRLIISDPKAAEFLLRSSSLIRKSYEYKFFHPWLGTGLLTSWGPKWKRQRKLITPTFHFQILEQFNEIFDAQSDILVEKLQTEVGGEAFNIFPYVTLCALDVICEAAMGTAVNAQKNSDSEYVRGVKEMCRIIVDRAFSPAKMVDYLYKFSSDYQKEKKALNVLHGYTNFVINKRRQELADSKSVSVSEDETGIKKRLAFLDLLLQCNVDGEPLSNEVIREEVDTFMFEGHDTTTSGISFSLYCLSKNPEVQRKVVKELKTIFTDDKTSPTYNDLQNMKYLDMVVKETLRLFPPVPFYSRILDEDVEYDGGILPKGLSLTLSAFGLHRQPEVFPDPDRFDPDRFSAENSAGRSPYAYIPFSAGPRNCIGQRFAVLEIKSTVAKVLRNYELLPVEDHEPVLSYEAILKSANGLLVRLKKREF